MDHQIQAWLTRDPDSRTREELLSLQRAGDIDELQRRFGGRLQFGTAGLRGIVGAGPMRMNRLVVRETSAGLADYLQGEVANALDRGVVITYDARPDSGQFALDAASVFLGAGFTVYLTDENQPTPLGAFGVLHYGAAAGVVVTASHNPPQYNGYKVYWDNGAQIIPPHDGGIAERIDAAATREIPWMTFEDALHSGRLRMVGEDLVEEYIGKVLSACVPGNSGKTRKIGVAYTALHGVGARHAERLLLESGLCDFASVAGQHEPDGTFPTVNFPNPEEPGAMDAVIELARERRATLACANDPDADRLAVAARNNWGGYEMLTGDQIGVLLGSYQLEQPHDFTPIVCASLVSSRMLRSIAEDSGAMFHETLTGFKWLSNVALQHEDDNHRFLFAYEEALGYALGQLVRDKDGLSALLAFCTMAAELAANGQTVLDKLEVLYRRHGIYVTEQRSIATEPGAASITDRLRAAAPAEIAGHVVASAADLQDRGEASADVLVYYLEDESRIIVRPSGTEPKTKCYYEVVSPFPEGADYETVLRSARQYLGKLADQHQSSLAELLREPGTS